MTSAPTDLESTPAPTAAPGVIESAGAGTLLRTSADGETARRFRLALTAGLMFILHSVHASWVPIFPRHLQALGFDADAIGLFFGVLSIATILAPWIGGQIADRLLAAERLIAICLVVCGGIMWAASRETRFWPLTGLMIAHQLLYMPTFSLCNHIAFSHLRDGPRNFGYIRLFGTAGWVIGSLLCGWVLSWQGMTMAHSLVLAAVTAILAAVISISLPPTHPTRSAGGRNVAAASLALLRMPDVAVMMAVSFGLSLATPFVYPHGSLYLSSLGVADASIPPIMSLGQVVEVAAFALMASLVVRFTFRTLFIAGLICWLLRFSIWSADAPFGLVVASMGLHGVCYAMIYGLGMIYIDRRATPDIRASAQGLHLVLTMGLAIWPGNWLAARVSNLFSVTAADGSVSVDYERVFLVPLAMTLVCAIAFVGLFREPNAGQTRAPAAGRQSGVA